MIFRKKVYIQSCKSKILFEDISRYLKCKIKENNRKHLIDYFLYTEQNINYCHFQALKILYLNSRIFLSMSGSLSTFRVYQVFQVCSGHPELCFKQRACLSRRNFNSCLWSILRQIINRG